MSRLFFLLLAVAASQGLQAQAFAPRRDPSAPQAAPRDLSFDPLLKPFYHGVASGDPTAESVIIWTRVTPEQAGAVNVDYRVATDPGFQNIVTSGQIVTDESLDYTVKIDVSGLQPGSTYYYYFSALGANSLIGRAKTTPAGPVDHLRFGVMSCSNYEGGYFNAYGMLAQRNDLDAVIHLGDYIYEYGTGVYSVNLPGRTNEPPGEILSLEDYRTRYSLYHLDPDLIRLHQQHTMISVWDDHEFANDAYKDGAQNHQPDEGEWSVRKAISKQVYFEWMPVRNSPVQEVYRAISYGDLCDLVMLDTRVEGRDEPPIHFDTPDDPVRNMISQEQFSWLIGHLKNSPSHWKLIGNQVLFTDFNVGFAGGAFDGSPDPTNLDSIRIAEDIFIDNWESYPTQRNALIDTLRDENIDNVVIVSGDSHSSWAFEVTKKPVIYPATSFFNLVQPNPFIPATLEGYNPLTAEGSWAVEFGTPSISSPNFDEVIGASLTAQFEQYINHPLPGLNLEYNPHLKYVDLDRHGYILLDMKPDTVQANYYYIPSQYLDTLAENFGQGVYVLHGSAQLHLNDQASEPKATQDQPAPVLPYGLSGIPAVPPHPLLVLGVSPNPAPGRFYIQIALNKPLDLVISLTDQSGKQWWSSGTSSFPKGISRVEVAPGGYTKGVHFLCIEAEGKRVCRQIVLF